MKRTTIKLPDDLDARLRHEAARRGIPIAELAREAIESHLCVRKGSRTKRRRLPFIGSGRSGRHDISERVDEILARELGR